MSGALEGLRVLDLGTRIAAPFCAGLLGEQGADVVKVEQPGRGDFIREIGPFVDSNEGPYSLFWAVEGRGRRSITVDLRRSDGQDLLRRLAAQSDVLVENFRPGTMEKWGIAPVDLPERLVTVRISTFGQDGPYSPRPGLDRLGIGYGGLLHLTGYPDRPPVRVGVTISDYLTGVFAAQAATAALYARDTRRDGRGAVIDAALYGSALRILEWTIAGFDQLGEVRGRQGNRLSNSAPLDNYPTADGKFVCIVAGSDTNFERLCAAMERPDLPDDPRFGRLAERASNGDEINGIVEAWTSSLDAAEIERRCVAHDVPVATAYTAADMFADPHFDAREDLVTVDDPVIGPVRQQASYPRISGQAGDAPSGAPRLGEHTDEVLREALGLSSDEITRLPARRSRLMVSRAADEGLFERAEDGSLSLVGGFSATSGQYHFPCQPVCPYVGADDVERTLLSGRGTLWGHTTVTISPPGYRGEVPYGFGIVELTAEGLRVVGRLTESEPDRLTYGMAMEVVADVVFTDDDGTEVVTWAFSPVRGDPR